MPSTFVTTERGLGPEGRVAVVRFDRGDRTNALSPEAMRQLRAAARGFEDDLSTSVVVLTGNGRAFSAGFDLKDTERREKGAQGLGELRKSLRVGPSMCRAWAEMEQVTICAIEGFAIGGGAALAVSTDFRVLARGAHMRIPEVALGLNMSWGSIPRMLQLMGPARTKQAVILADERISSADALAWGLVEHLADDGRAFDVAMDLANRVAAMPPIPVKMTKTTVNRLAGALDDLAGHMDLDQFALTATSEDNKEGISAFLEKRKPRFRGR
jgi:enoyl-CoA hydratase/carnithine racemase